MTSNPLMTVEALRAFRERQMVDGFEFPLNATSLGMDEPMIGRVRRISSVDRAAIKALPQEIQDTIWTGIDEVRKSQAAKDADPTNLEEMFSGNEKVLRAADAFAEAAFIEPRLVKTEQDLRDSLRSDPNEVVWMLSDVAPDDRISLFVMCMDADSASAKKLKLFRRTGRTVVSDGDPLSVGATAEQGVGAKESGLHAVPVS